jgi:hypothetical protein
VKNINFFKISKPIDDLEAEDGTLLTDGTSFLNAKHLSKFSFRDITGFICRVGGSKSYNTKLLAGAALKVNYIKSEVMGVPKLRKVS